MSLLTPVKHDGYHSARGSLLIEEAVKTWSIHELPIATMIHKMQ